MDKEIEKLTNEIQTLFQLLLNVDEDNASEIVDGFQHLLLPQGANKLYAILRRKAAKELEEQARRERDAMENEDADLPASPNKAVVIGDTPAALELKNPSPLSDKGKGKAFEGSKRSNESSSRKRQASAEAYETDEPAKKQRSAFSKAVSKVSKVFPRSSQKPSVDQDQAPGPEKLKILIVQAIKSRLLSVYLQLNQWFRLQTVDLQSEKAANFSFGASVVGGNAAFGGSKKNMSNTIYTAQDINALARKFIQVILPYEVVKILKDSRRERFKHLESKLNAIDNIMKDSKIKMDVSRSLATEIGLMAGCIKWRDEYDIKEIEEFEDKIQELIVKVTLWVTHPNEEELKSFREKIREEAKKWMVEEKSDADTMEVEGNSDAKNGNNSYLQEIYEAAMILVKDEISYQIITDPVVAGKNTTANNAEPKTDPGNTGK